MLTLLTTTGARPEAFAHCQRWMARQDFAGQVRWVIVDDGPEAQEINFERANWTLDVLRPEPFWSGSNTQARNLNAGLDAIHGDQKVIIIEDDDWYAPDWLSVVDKALDKHELVGEKNASYYNLPQRKWKQHHNERHASLCATAVRGAAINTLRSVARPSVQFIDVLLWQAHGNNQLFSGRRVIGMKGLPGRKGIGSGHDKKFQGESDPKGKMLKQWIGEEAKIYLQESNESEDDEKSKTFSWLSDRGD